MDNQMDNHTQSTKSMGISGKIASYFQSAQLTPLLAIVAFLLGIFAVLVTPREEEPQIDVTMANVIVPFPGATVAEVNAKVAIPAEQVLDKMPDVEHVYSVSHAGMAVMTVQFKVGVPRKTALVNLYDTIQSNQDWLPQGLGVMPAIIKPKGIDDVPMMAITLYSKNENYPFSQLEKVAHSLEADIKRIKGTRDVVTIGARGSAVQVQLKPTALTNTGVSLTDIENAIKGANAGMPSGNIYQGNKAYEVRTGDFLKNAQDVGEVVVGVRDGSPIYLADVAKISQGALPAKSYVWYGENTKHTQNGTAITHEAVAHQAITISITKKAGENAINIANAVEAQLAKLENIIIPADVSYTVTRNYGATANNKAKKLIQKLIFATLSVIVLVFIALGRREAFIVGTAVILTLTVTLFASWAYGFTLNRVSLFALIFSIGILVDDAIVVVENIHRHQALYPNKTLLQLIPSAVDEVGSPTILATFTVIAALLPMAFVSGLMGPYMSPIPINASMGMLLSLMIAFVVTPWLARIWLKPHSSATAQPQAGHIQRGIQSLFTKVFSPLIPSIANGAINSAGHVDKTSKAFKRTSRNRRLLGLGIVGLIAIAMLFPMFGLVHLKMLPFDNKSEVQVVVDMPAGTPVEQTAAVLQDLSSYLQTVPEVANYQAYAGTASPINFNGLVRQYNMRQAGEMGDIQVNLVDKHERDDQSHVIATRLRPELQKIGKAYGANVKVVEVPPGPPVMSPIVAEIYGVEAQGRKEIVKQLRSIFANTESIVDIDDSLENTTGRFDIIIDKTKAATLGIVQASIVDALHTALDGKHVAYLHEQSKYPASVYLSLAAQDKGEINNLLQIPVRGMDKQGKPVSVPIAALVTVMQGERDAPIYRKDMLPMDFVVADMAGKLDSPLYGMFAMRADIKKIKSITGEPLKEYFISQPDDPYRDYAIKWDGEWQITYETFRDMGLAYAVGLILIYLLVVAQFGSYSTPLIIMAPIPLTIIGVMPGHALLGAQFTATSMIGMIALAGIIVRNSILLVDFINLQVRQGVLFEQAIVNSAITRAQPIVLTALAAMMGAFFILDDPIFNGLAISLIFGILVSTVLTLVIIPLLYYKVYRNRLYKLLPAGVVAGINTNTKNNLDDVPNDFVEDNAHQETTPKHTFSENSDSNHFIDKEK